MQFTIEDFKDIIKEEYGFQPISVTRFNRVFTEATYPEFNALCYNGNATKYIFVGDVVSRTITTITGVSNASMEVGVLSPPKMGLTPTIIYQERHDTYIRNSVIDENVAKVRDTITEKWDNVLCSALRFVAIGGNTNKVNFYMNGYLIKVA